MSQLVFWLLGKRVGTEKSPGEAAFKSAPPASFHFIIIAPVWEPFLPGGHCRPSRGILLQRVLCVSRQILPDTSDPWSVPSPHVYHFACFCPGAILAFCCLGSTPVSTPISFPIVFSLHNWLWLPDPVCGMLWKSPPLTFLPVKPLLINLLV